MINLHTHSHYSVLDGFCSPTDIAKRIKELGQTAWALTDHGTLSGVVEGYKASEKLGLKFIFGVELYMVADVTVKSRESNHVIFYAKNQTGFRNLIKLVSEAHKNFYYTPRCDPEMVAKYKEGLICTSACLSGIGNNQILLDSMRVLFGTNFFIEIHTNTMPEQSSFNKMMSAYARSHNIKTILACDAHYIYRKQAEDHRKFCKIKSEEAYSTDDFFIHSDLTTGYANEELVGLCEFVKLPSGHFYPQYNSPNPKEELKNKMWANWKKSNLPKTQEYIDRAKHEIDVLGIAGYYSYFLIVNDICEFARQNNIPVGDGRGSIVGSLTSRLLGITSLDPIKYNLLFERFVHTERKSPPDADVDFSKGRRQEVIAYIQEKYGEVYNIRTFDYMGDKSALRRSAKVLGMTQEEITMYAGILRNGELENAKIPAKLKSLAISMRGAIQSNSTHPCGVVVFPFDPTDYVPIEKQGENFVVAWEYEDVEEMGFLKLDILGLNTLDVIDSVEKVDWDNIPDDDPLTFEMLCKGDTFGVFQIESEGMTSLVKKLQPKSIKDLVPLVALYRPGPMDSGMLNEYVARKTGQSEVHYYDEALKPILEETYGIIVYQEQVMLIARELGGYTLGEADMLRRAIGKKKNEELVALTEELRLRCIGNGISDAVANELVHDIITFGNYGFNKSHAAAYAYTAFKTAYLKVHYPDSFLCGLLNSEIGDLAKTAEYVRKTTIPILPVDIMRSKAKWSVEDKGVRIGISAIKGIAKEELVNAETLQEFVKLNRLNKGHMKAIEKAMSNEPTLQTEVLGFTLIDVLEMYDISLSEKRNDVLGGVVIKVKPHVTKTGKPMSFVDIRTRSTIYNLVLFSNEEIEEGEVYLFQISGTIIRKCSKAPRKA